VSPRLHFDVHAGRGRFLLLVHGFLSSRAQWLANLEALGRVCRPVTVELWGHGRSPAPENPGAYGVDSYVAQFEQIRADLGADRWLVCGQSFGAGLTIRYGLSHPEALLGQVITNSVSALTRPTPGAEAEAERARTADAILAGGAEGLRDMPVHPRFSRRLDPEVTAAILADAELLSPPGIANSIRLTGPGLAAGDALAGLTVPTLLVNGLWEKAFQPLRRDLPGRLPGVEIADLEGGHSINAEAPEAFNRCVGDFIGRQG
jgi:2-succinyl-6-hydroxy-2,4-cyclohexadiene-1-carboxylate synthase